MYVCMYTYVLKLNEDTHLHTQTYIHSHITYIHTYTYIHTQYEAMLELIANGALPHPQKGFTYTHTHIHICTHTYIHTHTHTHTHIHT